PILGAGDTAQRGGSDEHGSVARGVGPGRYPIERARVVAKSSVRDVGATTQQCLPGIQRAVVAHAHAEATRVFHRVGERTKAAHGETGHAAASTMSEGAVLAVDVRNQLADHLRFPGPRVVAS